MACWVSNDTYGLWLGFNGWNTYVTHLEQYIFFNISFPQIIFQKRNVSNSRIYIINKFILHSLHNTWYKNVALHCQPYLKPSPKTSQFDFEYIILTCFKVSQRYTIYILILAYIVIPTTYEFFFRFFPSSWGKFYELITG